MFEGSGGDVLDPVSILTEPSPSIYYVLRVLLYSLGLDRYETCFGVQADMALTVEWLAPDRKISVRPQESRLVS